MILQNYDYVDGKLEDAVKKNSEMITDDKSRWFYKKWRGLMRNSGHTSRMESRLEEHMRRCKGIYRRMYETGMSPYPTRVPFTEYKRQMVQNGDDTLMEILRRLPKGGLLHVHSAAALSADGLIVLLEDFMSNDELPTIYIETAGNEAGKMSYKATASGTQITLQAFYESYPNRIGAEQKLKEWMTVGAHTNQNPYIWDEFNKIFMRTSDLFANETFYYEYHTRFFVECMVDRIDYVELRCGFQEFVGDENQKQANVVLDQSPKFLDLLMAARDEAVTQYQHNDALHDWKLPFDGMGLGVILCARRDLDTGSGQDRDRLMKKIDAAIVWKLGPYSKLIKGFDFVSEEDRGKASYTYYRDIYYGTALTGYTDPALQAAAASLMKTYNPDAFVRVKMIELMLHAGESLWMEQENIIDAKEASRLRVGHGFQMLAYPGAMGKYIVGNMTGMPCGPVLEVCPISNQMLRYFPDIRNHYALMLMKLGIPCVLANDDPQILENQGLSYDFWEIYMASEGGLMLMKGLVFTAFLFHCQHRYGKPLYMWEEDEYEMSLMEFQKYYWEPFLEEMSRYFEEPED